MLAWVLTAGAVFCLIYYITIVLYSGIGTSFACIWLLFAAVMGATAVGIRYYQKSSGHTFLWLPVSLVTLLSSGVIVMVVLQLLMFTGIPASAEPGLDYLIVLGAQVKAEGPSKTLQLRLDKAAEYALLNPGTVMILSGGQGTAEPDSEAHVMQKYLLDKGVPRYQMLLEERSASTVENIAYSRLLLKEPKDGQSVRIGLLTSNFHLYRAKKIAQRQGLPKISCIAAESDRVLFLHFCFRDGLAILKDRIAGNL